MKKSQASVFARRLREARIRLGIPQDQLGWAIGLDEHAASARISRYETGIHQPAIEIASTLAKVLNVPLAYLYCENDSMAEIILLMHKLKPSELEKLKKHF